MAKPDQLVLPVLQIASKHFDNFVAGDNPLVIEFLCQKIDWLAQHHELSEIVYLHSQKALGKSHLLQASVEYAEQQGLSAICFDMAQLVELPTDVLSQIEAYDVICLDNINQLCHSEAWQVAVFDLINKLTEQGKHLIVFAATLAPKELKLTLPDLLSRLEWGTRFKLKNYQDDDKIKIIHTYSRSRGLNISVKAAKYLILHHSRDIAQIIEVIDRLNAASLKQQRSISIPFIKAELGIV